MAVTSKKSKLGAVLAIFGLIIVIVTFMMPEPMNKAQKIGKDLKDKVSQVLKVEFPKKKESIKDRVVKKFKAGRGMGFIWGGIILLFGLYLAISGISQGRKSRK